MGDLNVTTRCPDAARAAAVLLASAVVLAAAPAAVADGAPDAVDAVRACRAERDDARRLACFDAASAQLGDGRFAAGAGSAVAAGAAGSASAAGSGGASGAAPATAGATAGATGATTVAQMTPEERFGFRGDVARETLERQRAELPELERLTTTVQSASRQGTGDFVVALANGQVWAQLPTGTPQRLKAGDEVTISPASLGSYVMKLPNGRGVRVKRVR